MSSACQTCKGKGRWQVKEVYSDGDEMIVWRECNDCKGYGIEQDPEAGEAFDIAGSSFDDDD